MQRSRKRTSYSLKCYFSLVGQMTVTWHLSDGWADNNFTNELYSPQTSRHLVSDKCRCHVTCPKDESFSSLTATSAMPADGLWCIVLTVTGLILCLGPANERLCNAISHRLGANLESALCKICRSLLSTSKVSTAFDICVEEWCKKKYIYIHSFWINPHMNSWEWEHCTYCIQLI